MRGIPECFKNVSPKYLERIHIHHPFWLVTTPNAASLLRLCLALFPLLVKGASAAVHWDRDAFASEILVIDSPAPSSPDVASLPENEDSTSSEPTFREAVYQRLDGGEWKQFEDDLIAFEYPDDPELKLEILAPEQKHRLKIVGGAVTSADNGYSRAYQLSVQGKPYGILLLSESEWFDEGICFCGAIVLKRIVLKEGTLQEFSLLKSGQVKKVQALGARHRAVLFEWTHSAITPEAYNRIGASLRLKVPSPHSLQKWQEIVRQKRPDYPWSPLSFLSIGSTQAEIESVLGKASTTLSDCLVFSRDEWDQDGEGQRSLATLKLKSGKLAKYPNDFLQMIALQPVYGSLAWAEKMTLVEESGEKNLRLESKVVGEIYSQFKSFSQKTNYADYWQRWCGVLHALAEANYRDDSVLPLVVSHFFEPELEQNYATYIIKDYHNSETESLWRKRLELLLKEGAKPENQRTYDTSEVWSLLVFLDLKEVASLNLLREALAHPDMHIRASAYGNAEALPQSEAIGIAHQAIEKETEEHAITMATYLLRDVGTSSDLNWLKEHEAHFPSKSLHKTWVTCLAALEERLSSTTDKPREN